MKRKSVARHRNGLLPITYNGNLFDRQRALQSGLKFCVYEYTVIDGYGYLNPDDFYIGKGIIESTNKPKKHNIDRYGSSATDENFVKLIREHPEDVIREILFLFENESDAYAKEEEILSATDENGIALWQQPNCINRTPGGKWINSNSFTGMKHDEDTKRTIGKANSISLQGNQNARGHKKSKEAVDDARERTSDLWQNNKEFVEKTTAAIRERCGKQVLIFYNNRIFELQTRNEGISYFGYRFVAWLNQKSMNYKQIGIDSIRYKTEGDSALETLYLCEYPDILKELHRKIKFIIKKHSTGKNQRFPQIKKAMLLGIDDTIIKFKSYDECAEYTGRGNLREWISGRSTSYLLCGIDFIRYETDADKNLKTEDPWLRNDFRLKINRNTKEWHRITHCKPVVFEFKGMLFLFESVAGCVEYFQRGNRSIRRCLLGKSSVFQGKDLDNMWFYSEDDAGLDLLNPWEYPAIRNRILEKLKYKKPKRPAAKSSKACNMKRIRIIFNNGKKPHVCRTQTEGAKLLGISVPAITNIINGKHKPHPKHNVEKIERI